MRCVLSPTPLDLIDFLFYFQGFEVIELGFMRLKLGVELVLACFLLLAVRLRSAWRSNRGLKARRSEVAHRFVSLKKNDATSFVACSQIVSSMIEFYCRNDVRCSPICQ